MEKQPGRCAERKIPSYFEQGGKVKVKVVKDVTSETLL